MARTRESTTGRSGSGSLGFESGALILAAVMLLVSSAALCADEPQPDPVCEHLYADYINRVGKIDSETMAASQILIARRGGRAWSVRLMDRIEVLTEAEERNSQSIIAKHLVILIQMLKRDGSARWQLERPEVMTAWEPTITVPGGVLDRLIGYTEALLAKDEGVGRRMLDHPIMALAASRAPDVRPLLMRVLKEDRLDSQVRFHAAVGLAEQSEHAGLRWLATHADASGFIFNGAHRQATSSQLGENCRLALADLSGEQFESAHAWTEWIAGLDAAWLPRHGVSLRYPPNL